MPVSRSAQREAGGRKGGFAAISVRIRHFAAGTAGGQCRRGRIRWFGRREAALCCEVRGGGGQQPGCWCDWVCRGRLQSTGPANQGSSRSVLCVSSRGPMHPPHSSPQQPLASATRESACHPSEHRQRQLTRRETQSGLGNRNGTIGPASACRMQWLPWVEEALRRRACVLLHHSTQSSVALN